MFNVLCLIFLSSLKQALLLSEKKVKCDFYHCASKEVNFVNMECSKKLPNFEYSDINIRPNYDSNKKYLQCDFLNQKDKVIEYKQKVNLAAGSDCIINSNCSEDAYCINNRCSGKPVNYKCSANEECNVGLYCKNDKCIPQINSYISSTECIEDYDCLNFMGCNKGKCYRYLSLKAGTAVDNEDDYLLCESLFVDPTTNTCQEAKLVTSREYDRTHEFDYYLCDEDQTECRYSIPFLNKTITKKCECSYADPYNKYCPSDSAYLFKNLKNSFFYHISNDLHSVNRAKITDKFTLQLINFPKYVNADDCLLDRVIESSSNSLVFCYILLILLLLLQYI